jgi:hypothetical protein
MKIVRKNEKAVNIRKTAKLTAPIVGVIAADDYEPREAKLNKAGDFYKIEGGFVLASLFAEYEEIGTEIENPDKEEITEEVAGE